jgi:hypothetical protein
MPEAGSIPAPGSWFAIQVKLALRAGGYLVRDDDTVRRSALDDEIQLLANQLRSELRHRAASD